MRPENVWFVAQGRGFNSRHLHPCDLRRRWSVGTKVVIRSFGWLPSVVGGVSHRCQRGCRVPCELPGMSMQYVGPGTRYCIPNVDPKRAPVRLDTALACSHARPQVPVRAEVERTSDRNAG